MAFAFAKTLSSLCCWVVERPASHAPQLVVTTCPALSVTTRLYMTVKSALEVDAAM